MLACISQESYPLNPCSLVLQRYIAWKVVAISLFVTTRARPVFIACCKQTMSTKGDWIGASISYRDQEDLKQEHAGIIDEAARLLHQEVTMGLLESMARSIRSMDGKSIFPYSRDGFEKVFADELYSGRIIITGWAYDESVQLGYGSVVVGGQDHMEA
ncbi:hypothetical protein N7499_002908 [Penicillium canescens]|uniref:Uncharacterized protein n=1 Tax=Penicillium canescens TaxID=5083 RepID=A0AAD6HXN5_PENCN|nr:hypothetical protein N7460_014077 [Penicillium canescens]KAJ6066215.1 hypothetical protein N7444_000207 [Penicillium canescens]KAJ6094312.1 hypothetical protein N7499_002908 [Penicillium canescens]KAJ6174649.1 hypothetical protein N7485_005386 [Penicillium canescens]